MTKRETRLAEELEDLRKSHDIALRLLQQALEELRHMTKAEYHDYYLLETKGRVSGKGDYEVAEVTIRHVLATAVLSFSEELRQPMVRIGKTEVEMGEYLTRWSVDDPKPLVKFAKRQWPKARISETNDR